MEADEVYITAGHKGHPAIVASEKRKGRRRKLKGKRGRGTLADEKPPVLGMIQRNGDVCIQMMPNVQQVTIKPVMTKVIKPGSMVYTDEYDIYTRLPEWGSQHKCVNHSAGEYARDETCPEPAEGMAMAFTKSTLTQWKDFGLYCVHGCVHIVVFRKKNCLDIWVYLSSFTMSGDAEKPCCILSSLSL